MEIVNINYKGKIACKISTLNFSKQRSSPQQLVYNCANGEKLLVFTSGKCRLMGCKTPICSTSDLPIPVMLTNISSITLVMKLDKSINLINLANKLGSKKCTYEPELFPAVRLTAFNPLCVNVFASGKIVILGVKTLNYIKLCDNIKHVIFN
jgi:TATA-box binding protein (TBP) (component of TFIID and TFIIIB)